MGSSEAQNRNSNTRWKLHSKNLPIGRPRWKKPFKYSVGLFSFSKTWPGSMCSERRFGSLRLEVAAGHHRRGGGVLGFFWKVLPSRKAGRHLARPPIAPMLLSIYSRLNCEPRP